MTFSFVGCQSVEFPGLMLSLGQTLKRDAFLKDSQELEAVVIKADGLALGKGVLICENEEQAAEGVKEIMLDKKFGASGNHVVVEEFLTGPEVSVLSFTDGKVVKPMVSSMDHKRANDHDTGLNTGGMGTIAPNPYYTPEVAAECMEKIFLPTIRAMNAEGCPFKGCLYFGLMLTPDGPKVIEYNCRFGDPETQPIMLRMKSDLVDLCLAACDGKLDEKTSEWDERASLGVVIAAGGYPGNYNTGHEIHRLPLEEIEGGKVFHAGTKLSDDDRVLTNGGRVLCATALGYTVAEAQKRAYALMTDIHWDGSFSRNDIGWRAIEREQR